jgi:hypothetical protein
MRVYTLNKRYFTDLHPPPPPPSTMILDMGRIEKTGFQMYEIFKGSFLGYTGRTIECQTCFKFCRAEKGFSEKI